MKDVVCKMKFKRVMIAAARSGSGKTTVTCALLKALMNNGQTPKAYKCGPDFIDPMFHTKVIGIPSKNLDTFFTGEEMTKMLLCQNITDKDFAVIEGVMGLYDGLGGIKEEGSSYHLAMVTKTPIILVMDAKGVGRSIIPLIAGLLGYDREKLIKGVILNRMSKAYYDMIKPLIEQELNITVAGYLPDNKDLHIESRHLGLVMPDELADIKRRIQTAAEEFVKTVSLKEINKIAENAGNLKYNTVKTPHGLPISAKQHSFIAPAGRKVSPVIASAGREESPVIAPAGREESHVMAAAGKKKSPVIAVARDEAFCFYYEDNLLMLREFGAKIKYFSPIHDYSLPKDCDALLIGGGYPELYLRELSGNIKMLRAVKEAFEDGMPIVAECGGFMYLHNEIKDTDGESYKMAGVIPAACEYKGRLARFGYVEVKEKHSCFLPVGERIKGHEFHYFDSTYNGAGCIAIKPVSGKEYRCVAEGETYWLGFPHLYYPSNPGFAKEFVRKAKAYRQRIEIK